MSVKACIALGILVAFLVLKIVLQIRHNKKK